MVEITYIKWTGKLYFKKLPRKTACFGFLITISISDTPRARRVRAER